MAQSFLHKFLYFVSIYYDIAFWSPTDERSIREKLHVLGILDKEAEGVPYKKGGNIKLRQLKNDDKRFADCGNFKVCFILNKDHMILQGYPQPSLVKFDFVF